MTWMGKMELFLERRGRLLFAALFAGVLIFRLAGLQAAPLNGKEAAEAWGAYNLLHGGAPGSSALYAAFTACLFFIGGAADGLARLLPALAGSALILLPVLFRGARTRLEAAMFAVLIACSPGVTALSAQAGGGALGLLAAAGWLFYSRTILKDDSALVRLIAGGLLLGLAIAAGPLGWSGLVIALIASGADRLLRRGQTGEDAAAKSAGMGRLASRMLAGAGLPGVLAGLLLGGTGLLFFPRALGAFAGGLTQWTGAFFSGWPPVGELLLLLAAYEPIALLFGIAGVVLVMRKTAAGEDRFWTFFTAVAGIWVLLRPAAFPDEALWVILPLLYFAVQTIIQIAVQAADTAQPWVVRGTVVVGLVSLVTAALSFSQYAATGNFLWCIYGIAALALGPVLLPALFAKRERLWRAAWTGYTLAWLIALLTSQVGSGIRPASDRRSSANELWWRQTAAADLARLRATLEDLSGRETGMPGSLDLLVQAPRESALGWSLLAYPAAAFTDDPSATGTAPAMVLAPRMERDGVVVSPPLAGNYRGQEFAVGETRAWEGFPPNLLTWWIDRKGPVSRELYVLWVREDLFPDSKVAGQ